MNVLSRLARWSVPRLVWLACVLALLGLAIMSFAVVSGKPLPVIFAMSFGHMIGIASLGCFFCGVLIDAVHPAPAETSGSNEEDTAKNAPE